MSKMWVAFDRPIRPTSWKYGSTSETGILRFRVTPMRDIVVRVIGPAPTFYEKSRHNHPAGAQHMVVVEKGDIVAVEDPATDDGVYSPVVEFPELPFTTHMHMEWSIQL